ncbi:MAG: hypothetical protein R3D30_07645 [Hyphomicrobiales bacterium]
MMRDFIMALLLLALAAIPIFALFGGPQPSVNVQRIEASLDR